MGSRKIQLNTNTDCLTCERLKSYQSKSIDSANDSEKIDKLLQDLSDQKKIVSLERASLLEVWQCADCFGVWQYHLRSIDNKGYLIRS